MAKNKITFEKFSARVEKIYNGRISIVKETYINTRHKVTAYCNVHKIYFEIKEAKYLTDRKANCPKCSKLSQHIKHIKNLEDAYKEFIEKYGNKFSYDETTYNGMKKEMKVHCNDCGTDFEITPTHHLKYNNGGCPNCHSTKIIKCAKCGKDIIVDRHVSLEFKMLCDECKKEIENYVKEDNHEISDNKIQKQLYNRVIKTNLKKCPFCGLMYSKGEKCKNELCNNFQTIQELKKLIPFGFDFSSIGSLRYIEEFNKASKVLLTEYFDNKLSTQQIFVKYNCKEYFNSEGTLRYFLKYKLKKQTRNSSEAMYNIIERGDYVIPNDMHNTSFKREYHMTWEGKCFLLRSSYESDFAKNLDELKIVYEVEKLRIRYYDTLEQKERISIPDFYLPETNTIVEIKSTYTLDVQNMKDRIAAYITNGYNFKLMLEHKECDINEIILAKNNEQFKTFSNKYMRRRKTSIGCERKYRWMHNNIERIKVALDEVEHYQQMGWILGGLSPQKQKENIANSIQPCAKLLDISEDN